MDKFIILSAGRSGSTLVGLSLLPHPELLYFGELFNQSLNRRIEESSHKTCGYNLRIKKSHYQFKHCEINDDGYEYLSDFYSQDVPFKSIGFKLMNHHLPLGVQDDVWDYIAEHTEIKIIHIHRNNMLEKICSVARAEIKGNHFHIVEPVVVTPFVLSIKDFKRIIKLAETAHPVIQKILKTHKVFQLEYEQINSDFQGCMRGVFEFLEVRSDIKTKPMLLKIAILPPNEEILNY